MKRLWHNLRKCPGICLEVPCKTTKPLSLESRSPCRDLNPLCPDYEAGVPTTQVTLCHIAVIQNRTLYSVLTIDNIPVLTFSYQCALEFTLTQYLDTGLLFNGVALQSASVKEHKQQTAKRSEFSLQLFLWDFPERKDRTQATELT